MRQPRIPKGTGETRRYLAVGLDCYLCLLVVGLLVHSCLGSPGAGAGRTAAVLVGQLTVLSFANQVLLTMAVRASAGKLIMGVRVIRLPDAGRPEFRRLVVRWLYGLLWLPLQPWHHLRRAATAEPPPPERLGGGPRPPRARTWRGCARSTAATCGTTGRRWRDVRAEAAHTRKGHPAAHCREDYPATRSRADRIAAAVADASYSGPTPGTMITSPSMCRVRSGRISW